jgi:hypothetical protein
MDMIKAFEDLSRYLPKELLILKDGTEGRDINVMKRKNILQKTERERERERPVINEGFQCFVGTIFHLKETDES